MDGVGASFEYSMCSYLLIKSFIVPVARRLTRKTMGIPNKFEGDSHSSQD